MACVEPVQNVEYFPEEKLELGQQCDVTDVCLDAFAQCRSGVCQCRGEYYNSNGICSMYNHAESNYIKCHI